MSKSVHVSFSEKEYAEFRKYGKSDTEAANKLVDLGLEAMKKNRGKHKAVFNETDLMDDDNFFYLMNYLNAKNINYSEFFGSLTKKIANGELEIKDSKLKINDKK